MSNQHAKSTHVIEPVAKHTHTAILLHGRGDNGPDFAEELFSSKISEKAGSETLLTRFPSWRWVFPSATLRWSTTFEEDLSAWFEAHSLSDPTSREDLQMHGIRESVADITKILDEEVSRLGGGSQNIVLGGISQGAAVGFWVLLYQTRTARKLGDSWEQAAGFHSPLSSKGFCLRLMGNARISVQVTQAPRAFYRGDHPLLSTAVFLGHGADDAYIDISLGRQARDVLSGIGFNVTWKEYFGAEQEGHWYKEPEELHDVAQFLATVDTGQYPSM